MPSAFWILNPMRLRWSRPARAPPARASSGNRSTWLAWRSWPIIYLVEDNGYAISVPVERQTAGGDVELGSGFPAAEGTGVRRNGFCSVLCQR